MPTEETIQKHMEKIRDSYIPKQIGTVVLDSVTPMVEDAVATIANEKMNYPCNYQIFVKGPKEYYIGLNHRGKVFTLYSNPVLHGKPQYNMGVHVQIDAGTNMGKDQFTSPLPEKGAPTIIHCLSMIVFYDDEDFIKFKTKYEGLGLQNVVFEFCKGGSVGVLSHVNGLHSTLINLSSHEYYTITSFGVTQIPQVKYEDISVRFSPEKRMEIQGHMAVGHDVLVYITKKSDIISPDPLAPSSTYDQPNTVQTTVIAIAKEQRLINKAIVPEKPGFIWRIYPNKVTAEYFNQMYSGDTILESFDSLSTRMEEKQKEKEAEYEEKRTNYNKKTFNFIFQGVLALFSGVALEKCAKKLLEYLRKFFSEKAKKAAAKTAAAAFKQAAKTTVWTTIKTTAVKVAKAIATSIATAGVTKILKGLFSKAVALFI